MISQQTKRGVINFFAEKKPSDGRRVLEARYRENARGYGALGITLEDFLDQFEHGSAAVRRDMLGGALASTFQRFDEEDLTNAVAALDAPLNDADDDDNGAAGDMDDDAPDDGGDLSKATLALLRQAAAVLGISVDEFLDVYRKADPRERQALLDNLRQGFAGGDGADKV